MPDILFGCGFWVVMIGWVVHVALSLNRRRREREGGSQDDQPNRPK